MPKPEEHAEEQYGHNEHFFEMGFEKAHTAVFFVDSQKQRIGMLKRSASVDFAPNLYTGIGGKIEKEEGHRDGALRELDEELGKGKQNFAKEDVREFGRVIINDRNIISYFAIPYENDALPKANEGIGELSWEPMENVLQLAIIPTTKAFMEEWQRRGWAIDKPFSVFITREDPNDINSPVANMEVREGLVTQY